MIRRMAFPTEAEARAFGRGVELVNDSALSVQGFVRKEDGRWVCIMEDTDYHDPDDLPEDD